MCVSPLARAVIIALAGFLSQPGMGHNVSDKVKQKDIRFNSVKTSLHETSSGRAVVLEGYGVPNYLQNLYRVFGSIPRGMNIQDLTVHALTPSKVKILSGKRIQFELKCDQDLLKDHLNQVEVVLSKKDTGARLQWPSPVSVTICWNTVSCSCRIQLVREDKFLIADITKQSFVQSLRTEQGNNVSLEIIVTYSSHRYRHNVMNYYPIVVFHSVPKEYYADFARSSDQSEFRDEQQHLETNEKADRRSKRTVEDLQEYNGPCKLHDWDIHFNEIGWNGWIIVPKQYSANLCVGECNTPEVINKVNLSSHAYIRHAYHEVQNRTLPLLNGNIRVPTACCVPIQFDPVSTLFKNMDGTLTLKRIDEAIATKCGCL